MKHFYKTVFRFCLPLLLLVLAWPAAAQTFQKYELNITAGVWDMAADDNGNVHILWVEGGYLKYGRITPKTGGYEVTSIETICSTAQYGGYDIQTYFCKPRIAVRRDGGSVHTVWGERTLRHAWKLGSSAWSIETVRAQTTNYYYVGPVCAVTPDERVHVLYEYLNYPGPNEVPMVYLTKPSGGAWSADLRVPVQVPLSEYRDPSMFVDSAGGLHVSYRSYEYPSAWYSYVAPGGTLSQSTPRTGLPYAADIIHNAFGDLYVDSTLRVHRPIATYTARYTVTIDYTTKSATGSFTTPTRPSIGDLVWEDWDWPAVVSDTRGWVYVAYWDEVGSPTTVYLSVHNGTSWNRLTIDSAAALAGWVKPALTATNSTIYLLWRSDSPVYDRMWIATLPNSAITVTAPNGGESWIRYTSHNITWTAAGATTNVNIELWKDGAKVGDIATNIPITPSTYSWSVGSLTSGSASPGTGYAVRVATIDGQQADQSDNSFTIVSEIESVSTPTTPNGPIYGYTDVSYLFTSGGAVSNHGHALEYRFDFDDGVISSWSSSTSASHAWSGAGAYSVKAQARCATHTSVVSEWSTGLTVSIAVPGQYYNSPANRLLIPEVNWAAASGGGDWISELHLGDLSGGTVVSVYYNSGTNRRGPFTLWTNSGIPGRSTQFANILQTIDGLDAGVFTYYGTSGTLELVTQDASHYIQATARTTNGNYSRTFPGLADVAANTADTSRQLVIPNISNNSSYRPSVVLTNPSSDGVTVEVKIIGADGVQIGSTIIRTLAGYEMQVITSEVRANTYSNAAIFIQPTSGSGRVMVSGQSANNASNDPAAHLAVQAGSGFANSPSQTKFITEVNWAAASGGGDWISELNLLDLSGGAAVQVYYNSGVTRRGPFTLWTNSGGANRGVTFANILQTISGLDTGFTYNGTSGTLELTTQDGSHLIQAAVRTYNGNFSRTFPAFADVNDHTASLTRLLIVPNLSNNSSYRPSVALFNPSTDSVTVELRIFGNDGVQIGSTATRTVAGREMNVVTSELRANTYSNANVTVQAISGSGRVLVSGQTANNVSNDPAAHIAVQGQ